jgi:tryptophan-rich sensory protein
MSSKNRSAPDASLLLSLLLLILLNPLLDHGGLRRLFLTGLTFVPVVLATFRLAQSKGFIRPAVLLMSITLAFGVASVFKPNPILLAIKWGLLAAFFALAVVGLFTYLTTAPVITRPQLYSAVSAYLLLGMVWFALYAAIDAVSPGAFQRGNNAAADRESELLYFSLVTISTVGYGDIIPLRDEARMLAALEGVTGVLYIAITVAILVSAFKRAPTRE